MKSSDSGKNIGCRDQYHKLAHDRYNHTEYCLSKCLEHSTRNNTEPCDQVMDTNNPKCRHTDRQHIRRSIEHSKKHLWNCLKQNKTDAGQAERHCHT